MAISLLNDKPLVDATLIDGVLEANNAANYRFRPAAGQNGIVRFALLTNNNGAGNIFYRLNTNSTDATASSEASLTVYDGMIEIGQTMDISYGGTRAVKDVSVFVITGATTIAVRLVGLA